MAAQQSPPQTKPAKPPPSQGELLLALFSAAFDLNGRVREAGKVLGTVTESGGASIALMRDLAQHRSITVAGLAKLRAQSRQHIQKLADQLAAEGYIEFIDNPAHKRSPLMRMTAQGETAFKSMVDRSVRAGNRLELDFDLAELRAAIDVVQRVTKSMDAAFNARP